MSLLLTATWVKWRRLMLHLPRAEGLAVHKKLLPLKNIDLVIEWCSNQPNDADEAIRP